MRFRRVPAAAPPERDKFEPRFFPFAPRNISFQGLSYESAHRPALAFCDGAQVSLEPFVDENGRAFHMMYDSIHRQPQKLASKPPESETGERQIES